MSEYEEKVILKLEGNYEQQATKARAATTSLSSSLKFLGGAAVVGAVVSGIKSSVQAFLDQEKATKRQEAALRALGITTKAATADIVSFATHLQRTTGVQDNLILDSTRLLTQFGYVGDVMKAATKTAIDLSSAFKMDLQSATMTVIKAMEGNAVALTKMGIKIDEADLKSRNFAKILGQIDKTIGGSAQAEMESFSGQVKTLGNEFGELSESVGEFFVNATKSTGIIRGMTRVISDLNIAMEMNAQAGSRESKQSIESANRLQELRAELEKVNKEEWFFAKARENRINELEKMISKEQANYDKLDASIGKVVETRKKEAEELKKQQAAASQAENAPKIKEEDRLKFLEFYRTLVKESGSAFAKIDAQRDADNASMEEWAKKGLSKTKEYVDAQELIADKALASTMNFAKTGVDSLGQLFKGNINGFLDSFQSMLPEVVGSAVGLARSAISTIGALFSMFGSKSKTEFEKITAYIDKVSSEFSKAMSQLEALRDEETKRSKGHVVEGLKEEMFSQDELGFLQQTYKIKPGAKGLQNVFKDFRAEIASDGTIFISKGGKVIGRVEADGEVVLQKHFKRDVDPQTEMQILKLFAQQFQNRITPYETQEPQGFAIGGYVRQNGSLGDRVPAMLEGGEFVVNRRNVNQKTIGLLEQINRGVNTSGGGGSFVFNIQTLDSKGVADFVEKRLRPMMRDMSRNTNSQFVSPKGVSVRA